MDRLIKIANIEEKTGISLDVLFDILINQKEIYQIKKTHKGYEIESENINCLECDDNGEFYFCWWSDYGCDISVKTKDFKQFWFLSKKEAEKEIKKLNNIK